MFRRQRRTTISDLKLVKLEIEPSKNTKDILTLLSQRVEQTSVQMKFTAITDKFSSEQDIVDAAQRLCLSLTHIMNSIAPAYQAVAPAGLTGQSLLIPGLENDLKVARFWQSNSFYFYVMQNIADMFDLLAKINFRSNPGLRAQLIDDLNLLAAAIFILVRSIQNELTIEQKNNFSVLIDKVRLYREEKEKRYDTSFFDKQAKTITKAGGAVLCFSLILGLILVMSSYAKSEKGAGPLYVSGLISFVLCNISISALINSRILTNSYANAIDKQAAADPILSMHKSALYGAKTAQLIFEESVSLDASYAKRYL